jgi:hypothetical protein
MATSTDAYAANWGPSYWRFIHYYTANGLSCRSLIESTVNHLPCAECVSSWVKPDINVNLASWAVALHNSVNTKLGKYNKWTAKDAEIANSSTCDICVPPPGQSIFPWPFIHTVARLDKPGALEFLKEFNRVYPCEICRGTFFSDEPTGGESLLRWTLRAHLVKDPLYIYPIVTNECPSCPGGVILSIGPTGPMGMTGPNIN